MYPFEGRLRWLASNRYTHVIAAFRVHGRMGDSLVETRIHSLERWGRLRTAVLILLYLGLAGAAITVAARFVPGLGVAEAGLERLLAVTGGLTSAFTLLYLALTRLLGQIEADILMLLILPRGSGKASRLGH